MQILFLSNLVSPRILKYLQNNYPHAVGYAVQKFNQLLVGGLSKNGMEIKSLSTFFLPNAFWHHKSDRAANVVFSYIPSVPVSYIRHAWVMIYCFFYVLGWGILRTRHKVLICDVLNVSACTGAVFAAQILRLKRVGIMTDMPGLMVDQGNTKGKNVKGLCSVSANKRYLDKFTHYVFLTEKMNEVNIHNRPYIVMEGLVSPNSIHPRKQKTTPRSILYAGGLHEKYGLRMLIDAIKKLPIQDIQLVLYGDGPIVDELKNERDSRIVYKGLASNDVIVEEEQKATLLVNPRPTHEEFTKYSFPSKNMEYMVSGTPLLTTRLPGMPKDYWPYVYFFEDETIDGFACKLKEILSLSSEELEKKGADARKFVLTNKTDIVQAARIIRLINQ